METTNVFMNWVKDLGLDLDTISRYVDRGASPGKVLRKEIRSIGEYHLENRIRKTRSDARVRVETRSAEERA